MWACFVETTHAGQGCPHLVPRACHDELLHHAGDAEDEDGYGYDADDDAGDALVRMRLMIVKVTLMMLIYVFAEWEEYMMDVFNHRCP